jgi:hypothetical protein
VSGGMMVKSTYSYMKSTSAAVAVLQKPAASINIIER